VPLRDPPNQKVVQGTSTLARRHYCCCAVHDPDIDPGYYL